MKYLFIGGPHDGQRHPVDYSRDAPERPRQTWTLAVNEPLPVMPLHAECAEVVYRTADYQAHAWNVGRERRWIFAPHKMQPIDIFDMLLDGYRNPDQTDAGPK